MYSGDPYQQQLPPTTEAEDIQRQIEALQYRLQQQQQQRQRQSEHYHDPHESERHSGISSVADSLRQTLAGEEWGISGDDTDQTSAPGSVHSRAAQNINAILDDEDNARRYDPSKVGEGQIQHEVERREQLYHILQSKQRDFQDKVPTWQPKKVGKSVTQQMGQGTGQRDRMFREKSPQEIQSMSKYRGHEAYVGSSRPPLAPKHVCEKTANVGESYWGHENYRMGQHDREMPAGRFGRIVG